MMFSEAIINHLWQSTLVVLLAWLLTLVLKRNPARTRYWVWMTASLKLLLPFSLLTAIGSRLGPAGTPEMNSPQIATTMVKMVHPFLQNSQNPAPATVTFPGSAAVVPLNLHHGGAHLPEVCAAVWLCGLFFFLLRWSRDWCAIHATLRAASRISLPVDLPVFLTSRMIEPGVVGIIRPVLLLPERLMDLLSAAQLSSILAHEKCHVQRRDNLTAAIHMVVEAIFWFYPAVWWMERRLIEERERACDEAVLQLGNEAEIYAESILNVCKFYVESPVPCISGVTGSELKQRIQRIMSMQITLKLDLTRKILLSAIGIAAIAAPMISGLLHITEVRAQSASTAPANIAATWQGILHTGGDLRFVVKIKKAEDGTLRATFYNLSAAPDGIPAISTTLNGDKLKVELPFASYEGTLSNDGNTITGTWKQAANPTQLVFLRAMNETEWTIPQPPPHPAAMAADADPSFEVATIKPSRPDEHGPRYNFQGRFSVIHASLSDLLKFSYGLQQSQIAKAQDWVNSESYDITAKPDGEGEPSIKQWESMVRKLMADRFQLKFHYEKREQSVYLLTVASTGPKLTKSDSSGLGGMGFGPPGNFGATNATMADISDALGQGVLNRPVVNQTGLAGKFSLRLAWAPDGPAPATESPNALPDFFQAIQDQLGLKVTSAKALVDVLVIDHAEKPSAN
jgi:uncharacterized protein (TIGR03435 family)